MTSLKCPGCGQELGTPSATSPGEVPCLHCGVRVSTRDGTRILPGGAAAATQDRTTPITRGEANQGDTIAPLPSAGGSTVTTEEFAFLAPPRGPDTLGWLAHYRVEKLLGQGGMGMVFQAEDSQLQRLVALKVMRPEMAKDDEFRQRFLREARAMAKLKNDHIVTIHQVADDQQITFLAMEYLQGETLDDALARGKMSVGEVVRIGREIALGLAAAHEKGLIHRDIKPANIWLEGPQKRVKILDFGLARPSQEKTQLTQAGLILGTPEYMAPEQADGDTVDHRCDLFSFGCVLYQMASGVNPFSAGSTMAVLKAVALRDPKPLRSLNPAVPEDLAALVHQLLAKKKEDRPQSAADVAAVLDMIATDPKVAASIAARAGSGRLVSMPPGIGGRRRVPWMSLAALAGLLLAGGLLAWSLLQGPKPDIVLGMSAPFEGSNKELGEELKMGIDAYLQRVNDQGGVNGRKIKLIALDDGYKPDRALANMKEFHETYHALGVTGNVGTPTAKLTVPYAIENKMLFFGGFSGANLLRKDPPDRYVFNYRASYQEETAKVVEYLLRERKIGPNQIAVFAQQEDDGKMDAYGRDGFDGVAKALKKHNIEPDKIPRVGYTRNKTDVEGAVEAVVQNLDVKAVVMVATYKPAARFIKQVTDGRKDKVIFTNVSFVGSDALKDALMESGSKYADGVIITQVVPNPDSGASGVIQYRDDLKRYFPNKQPSFSSLEGYIDAEILVDGLKRAGSDVTVDSVINGLESIKELELGIGTSITYSRDRHQGSNKVWGTVINKDGKFDTLELE